MTPAAQLAALTDLLDKDVLAEQDRQFVTLMRAGQRWPTEYTKLQLARINELHATYCQPRMIE